MALRDNLHSTVVVWLKVILPLIALAILSTLFLVSRTIDPEGAIPLAEVDVADRVRAPRLTAPTWAGMTDDGSALTVTADEARPPLDTATGATAQTLRAVLEMPDGGRAEVTAESGGIDPEGQILTLQGNIVITTSAGYRIEADTLATRLDRTEMVSPGPVAAEGPPGRLTAGTMTITAAPEASDGYVMVFNDGVRLVYHPAGQAD